MSMIGKLRRVTADCDVGDAFPSNPAPPVATADRAAPAVELAPQTGPSPARSSAPGSGPAGPAGRRSAGEPSVRIETAKLDALVDMVGELVIAQTLVGANPRVADDLKLSKDVAQVTKIVREAQEAAFSMRMIPIGAAFRRMARLVRDLARKAGKQVELVISGEETELDKDVIQQIGDPLIHMVRNAVDHGIESPPERRAAGKAEVGQVHLNAFHQGGNIVIQVRDDGRGLDPAKLIAKGIEKGLVQCGGELADEQAYGLIFAPGFSTAAQVTDISGQMLSTAQRGIYEPHHVGTAPPEYRNRYFREIGEQGKRFLQIVPELHKVITFARFNLMMPTFPFRHGFDVVFCRNVMIYFDRPTQQTLIRKIAAHLHPGGYLLIGHSESLHSLEHPLEYVEPAVYRRRPRIG
jgi:SAM-dependent methyltransferase